MAVFDAVINSKTHIYVNYDVWNDEYYYYIRINSVQITSANGLGRKYNVGIVEFSTEPPYECWSGSVAKGSTSKSWSVNQTLPFIRKYSDYVANAYLAVYLTDPTGGVDARSKSTGILVGTVYAKSHWTISYAANGGNSTPGAQTKWYNEDLTVAGKISHNNTSPGSYTVTLNYNGGGSNTTLTSTRTTSYSFANWKDSQGTTYTAGSGKYTKNQGNTLTAQWSTSETRAAVTLPTPTWSGHEFLGWYTSASGGTKLGTSYTPTGNVTIYAHWNRTVTYNANGHGTAPAAQTAVTTDSITLSSISAAEWHFVGWYDDPTNGNLVGGAGASYSGTASVVLYAHWERWIDAVAVSSSHGIRVNATYASVSPSSLDNPKTNCWYEAVTNGYQLTSDTSVVSGKTYYKATLGTTEEDEGTFGLVEVPFRVVGSAAATVTMTVSVTASSGSSVPRVENLKVSSAKYVDAWLDDTFRVALHGLSTEISYYVECTISVSNSSAQQPAVTTTNTVFISYAYFTIDVYNDGHGISFGAPAFPDAHNVSMEGRYYGRIARPIIEITDSALTTESLAKSYLESITDVPRPFYAYVSGTGGFYRVS